MKVTSPNGRISVDVIVDGVASYSVRRDEQQLIEPSRLDLELAGSAALAPMQLIGSERQSITESYRLPVGKTSSVDAVGNELTVRMRERSGLGREVDVVVRAFDDGVAVRYVVPQQPGISQLAIKDEHTELTLHGDPTLYTEATGFASAYEDTYRISSKDELSAKPIALPFVARYPNGVLMGVTEAGLVDYPNAYVTAHHGSLMTTLAPKAHDDGVKARVTAPFATPWRTMIIGESPKTLIESNLVTTLAPASVIADTSWIHLGKVQFGWWNGYVTPDGKGGINQATLEHYIDFCAANGIEYASIDGYEMEQAWYGGKSSTLRGRRRYQAHSRAQSSRGHALRPCQGRQDTHLAALGRTDRSQHG